MQVDSAGKSSSRSSEREDEHRLPPKEKLPRHIALIMDGNGRWARGRGLPRLRGHERGAQSLRTITRFCRSIGVSELTFYALSTENYSKRPRHEVGFLMRLLESYLVSERPELVENDIRLVSIGRVHELPPRVLAALRETERLTEDKRGMILRLALNYGGRQEILDAIRHIARDVASGRVSPDDAEAFGELWLRRYLYDPAMSDPDLLVRTAGERRLSNFLLWHSSYSEIWVTPKLWPEFDVSELVEAIHDYATRERKYGAVGPGSSGTIAESSDGPPHRIGDSEAEPEHEESR